MLYCFVKFVLHFFEFVAASFFHEYVFMIDFLCVCVIYIYIYIYIYIIYIYSVLNWFFETQFGMLASSVMNIYQCQFFSVCFTFLNMITAHSDEINRLWWQNLNRTIFVAMAFPPIAQVSSHVHRYFSSLLLVILESSK